MGKLNQDALASWLGRAEIFVHPTRYHPFGLAVFEAALAGCALVLGDIPSLREIWRGAPRRSNRRRGNSPGDAKFRSILPNSAAAWATLRATAHGNFPRRAWRART